MSQSKTITAPSLASLAACRSVIAGIHVELAEIKDAPIPLAEAKASLMRMLDNAVAMHPIGLGIGCLLQGRGASLDEVGLRLSMPLSSGNPILLGPLVSLLRPAIEATLLKRLEERAAEEVLPSLTAAQRTAKHTDAMARLLASEREEEGMVRALEADGREIARRSDVSIEVVLDVGEEPDAVHSTKPTQELNYG